MNSKLNTAIAHFDYWILAVLHAQQWTGPNLLIMTIIHIAHMNDLDWILSICKLLGFRDYFWNCGKNDLNLFKLILLDEKRTCFQAVQLIAKNSNIIANQTSLCLNEFLQPTRGDSGIFNKHM